jgi:GST-like protein
LIHLAVEGSTSNAYSQRNESPKATERVANEILRLLDVLEGRLAGNPYVAGEDYTIADIANYPWIAAAKDGFSSILGDIAASRPSLARWLQAVGDRPAVRRGLAVPAKMHIRSRGP